MAWADFDLDGDPDILLTGSLGSSRISRIYRNDGGGLFAWETAAVMLGVANSSVAWADYDRDGDPDILLTGNMGSGLISWIYRNDGGGLFSRETRAALPGASLSSVAWGDYDRDGDPDILLSGESDVGKTARIYRNDGGGVFIHDATVVLPAVAKGSVAWGDYDRDGDLDILLQATPAWRASPRSGTTLWLRAPINRPSPTPAGLTPSRPPEPPAGCNWTAPPPPTPTATASFISGSSICRAPRSTTLPPSRPCSISTGPRRWSSKSAGRAGRGLRLRRNQYRDGRRYRPHHPFS
ncbi:VCBS repeat-containing protein [bacterium]|nr:VCBS repeat-containing protein [bacterium]